MPDEPLTRGEIVEALRGVGVEPGSSLIVHSSCRSLGPVEGGAETVVDALLEAVGPEGDLMLPTFNYSMPLPDPHYDPATTPCRTGIIPELGRRRPEAVRSLHPTHSVAAIGPNAEELTRDHLEGRAFGVGSPVDRLASMGGFVLLMGVGHVTNSTVHVAEERAALPKAGRLGPPRIAKVLLPDGRVIEHALDTSPSCSSGFGGAEYLLRRHGEIRDWRLRRCKLQLMRAADVIRRVQEAIAEKADVLLCAYPECLGCEGTRENLRKQGRL